MYNNSIQNHVGPVKPRANLRRSDVRNETEEEIGANVKRTHRSACEPNHFRSIVHLKHAVTSVALGDDGVELIEFDLC